MKANNFVLNLSKKVLSWLKPYCKKIEIAGSIGRKEKNPKDIDVVLIPRNKEEIINYLKNKGKILYSGEKKAGFKINNVKVELYFTSPESWGATLLAYSSKKGSAIGLRIFARLKGYKLNQYGLFKGDRLVAGKTEQEIYHVLGRKWKPPEKR